MNRSSGEFSFRNGLLHMENVSVRQICEGKDDIEPMFIYSKNKIISNVQQYKRELEKQTFPWTINYSMKANANPAILKILKEHGCSVTVVSGMELKLALEMEFPTGEIVFNGNGKERWEIELAIENGVLLNIDSVFNLQQTITGCKRLNRKARVLLRVNPDIEVDVHQHNCTGKAGSKFGLDESEFDQVISTLQENSIVELVGLHCHLGSTIDNVEVIVESTEKLTKIFKRLKPDFPSLKYINIGGGLGIPYRRQENETLAWKSLRKVTQNNLENLFHELSTESSGESSIQADVISLFTSNEISVSECLDMLKTNCRETNPEIVEKLFCYMDNKNTPTAIDLIQAVKPFIEDDVHLILEPGRSLVGNAAILLCRVLGHKTSSDKNFIVVNGAMTEVIRPSLYGAYHHIAMAETATCEKRVFDVVGPVCESGDFLGKDRFLPTPQVGSLLAVFDVGAYCSSMSMTYNMRRRPAELMVDGKSIRVIRRADTYADLMEPYKVF